MNSQRHFPARLDGSLYCFAPCRYKTPSMAISFGLATVLLVLPDEVAAIQSPGELPTVVSGNAVQEEVARVILEICPDEARTLQKDLQTLCNNVVGSALAAGDGEATETAAALAQASPEQVSAQGTTEVRTAFVQYANIESRLAALRNGASGISLAGFGLVHDGQWIAGKDLEQLLPAQWRGGGASADNFSRLGIFLSGSYGNGDQDGTRREAGFDFDTYGITLGVDYRFTDSFILGGALGYNDSSADFDNNRGELDTDGYSLMLYGTYYPDEALYVDFLVFYGENDYDTQRHINYSYTDPALQDVDVTLNSSNDSERYGLSLGAGYTINRDAWSYQPFVELGYSNTDFDGFTESSEDVAGQGWALSVGDSEVETLTSTLGVQISRTFSQSWGVLMPQARLAWVHEFMDDSRKISARFVNDDPAFADDPNAVIQITTDDPDRNYGNLGLGLSATFAGGMSGFVLVEGLVAHEDLDQYQLSLGIRKEL